MMGDMKLIDRKLPLDPRFFIVSEFVAPIA
jgi:hypothetical protein